MEVPEIIDCFFHVSTARKAGKVWKYGNVSKDWRVFDILWCFEIAGCLTGKWHQVGNLGSEARVTAAGDQLTYDLNFLRRGIWMMIIVDRNSCDYHDSEDHDSWWLLLCWWWYIWWWWGKRHAFTFLQKCSWNPWQLAPHLGFHWVKNHHYCGHHDHHYLYLDHHHHHNHRYDSLKTISPGTKLVSQTALLLPGWKERMKKLWWRVDDDSSKGVRNKS